MYTWIIVTKQIIADIITYLDKTNSKYTNHLLICRAWMFMTAYLYHATRILVLKFDS